MINRYLNFLVYVDCTVVTNNYLRQLSFFCFMKCVKCKKQADIKVQNLKVCKKCFLNIIQKRVRKELRVNNLIEKDDHIAVIDDKSAEAQVSKYLLKKILDNLPVSISVLETKYDIGEDIQGDYDKVVIPWNADREGSYFLKGIMGNEQGPYQGHFKKNKKRYIKLLLPVISDEVKIFADIKGFEYKCKEIKDVVDDFIDELEEKYPEMKFSLLKSSKEITSHKGR